MTKQELVTEINEGLEQLEQQMAKAEEHRERLPQPGHVAGYQRGRYDTLAEVRSTLEAIVLAAVTYDSI